VDCTLAKTQLELLVDKWSKELDLPTDKLSTIIQKLTEKKLAWQSVDHVWKYPATGDTQKTCPMLDAMFRIEYMRGVVIFLPIGNFNDIK
jgi:hypothetical protein